MNVTMNEFLSQFITDRILREIKKYSIGKSDFYMEGNAPWEKNSREIVIFNKIFQSHLCHDQIPLFSLCVMNRDVRKSTLIYPLACSAMSKAKELSFSCYFHFSF